VTATILRFPTPELPAESAQRERSAPSDEAARASALDTRRSFIVEAPAGSGKTGLLVQRFLKLLADGDPEHPGPAQPEEVLAMTFTRKATAEMQQRVLEQLQSAYDHAPLSLEASPFDRETRALAEAVVARSAQLGWNLLAQPQRLNIRSILSVCLEIANSLPLLTGSGGSREPLDDARPLYRLAARRTLLQLGNPDAPGLHDALRTVLLHRDGSLADCESLIAAMLADREQWGELVPLGPDALDDATLDRQVRPKLERVLENVVCAGLSRALNAMPQPLLHELTGFAARHAHLPGYNQADSPISLCAGKHEPPEAIAADLDHWVALIRLLVKPSDGGWRKSVAHNHLGFKPSKYELDRLKDIIAETQTGPRGDSLREALCAVLALPPARYPDEQWAVARALFHILRRALVELKLLFAERSQCDYAELALAAREVLSEPIPSLSGSGNGIDPETTAEAGSSPADTALSAGGHLRHLLVDEMQDTSTAQYDLIQLLTSSWDGRSQTLFLVGDPKQSIYLFRQARVERFLRALHDQRLGDISLTPLRLTANFRSQAALVHAFNDTFGGSATTGSIFPPARPPRSDDSLDDSANPSLTEVDVPFVAATTVRPETIPDAIRWHTAVLGEEAYDPALRLTGVNSADHNAQEAIEIRCLIEQRIALPLPEGRNDPLHPKPWRIAVLARARNHLAAVVQQLKAHDARPAIPFRAVDLDPLDELPEVLDTLALTRALLHPADRVAWLAVLHAPWCGLGLADLLALTGEDSFDARPSDTQNGNAASPDRPLATLVGTRRQYLSPLGQRLLERVWPTLETAVATLGRTPLSVHVERTWRSLGGDAALSPSQRSNVLRFLRVLRELEAEGDPIDVSVLAGRLQQLYAEPLAGAPIHVDLMTIHKAKGLEWDLVLVPGLHRRPRGSSAVLLNWLELDDASAAAANDHEASILLAPIWGKGNDSDKLNDWLKAVRARRERAEEKRLFYVASTRAREELHLFAALTRRADDSLASPASGTLLKACWAAAGARFAPLAARPQTVSGDPIFTEPKAAPFIAQLYRAVGGVGHGPTAVPSSPAFEFDIAASANDHAPAGADPKPPTLQRLPLGFDASARFRLAAAKRLPYTPAAAPADAPVFERPEGSFTVRAFGNVVHRFLQVLAARLADRSISPEALLAELPHWEPRLNASLRGEGLPPALAARQATRALRALTLTLDDPVGRWILAPHTSAASERTLTMAPLEPASATSPLRGAPSSLRGAASSLRGAASSLRIDRTFLAGLAPFQATAPLSPGGPTLASARDADADCLWIIDFKTTDPGSRSPESFAAAEIAKYAGQLEAYARLHRRLPGDHLPIRLGLFYPLVPRLLHWPSASAEI
jgi:ATP-dependent helicase/nuclease subunit A